MGVLDTTDGLDRGTPVKTLPVRKAESAPGQPEPATNARQTGPLASLIRPSEDPDHEVAHLLEVEVGNLRELWFRYGSTIFGCILLYAYTGWLWALVWGGAFVGVHRGYVGFLRARAGAATDRDLVIASALFGMVIAIFMSVPTYLLISDDDALRFSAATVLGSMLVFLVRRSERLSGFIWIQVGIVGAFALAACTIIAFRADGIVPIVGIYVCGGVLVFYLAQASFITRAQRLAAERRAALDAQEHKMAAIGQLAGGVAHDFNNILTAILGNLELYREVDEAEKANCLAEAEAAAERAATLVRQLLVYARKSPQTISRVDAGDVLVQTMELTGRMVPATISQKLCWEGQALPVRVDRDLLITALMNLVNNAVDAMAASGGGTLRAKADVTCLPWAVELANGSTLGPGEYVALSIEDSGPGIAADMLPKVVEPYFTTKPVGKGSGLGLPMVSGFAETSGGGLTIESQPGRTVMTILLPLEQS